MAVPAGGEIAVYNSDVKTHQNRIAIGLDYPAWTADKTDTFGSALDPKDWMFTQFSGDTVQVTGGNMNIRAKGEPPTEYAITRPLWFPQSESQAFELEINATFPTEIPAYPSLILIGGLNHQLQHQDVAVILQEGVNNFTSAYGQTGQIRIGVLGSAWDDTFDGTETSHEYIFQWDPGLTLNATTLRVLRDGGEKRAVTPSDGARPQYVQFGFSWPTTVTRPSGTPPVVAVGVTAVETMVQVHDITVREFNGQGHETRVYPGWTSVNAGGDLDTAADGERFALDGETWAKLPQQNLLGADVNKGRSRSDTFSVELASPDPDDPDTTLNRFDGDHLLHRPIIIDTRIGDGAASETFTAWKRQIAGVVEQVSVGVDAQGIPKVRLSGRDIPSFKLDSFISRAYTDAGGGAGTNDSGMGGFTLDDIFNDLVEVADIVAGFILGNTDKSIFGPEVAPQSISTGGQSLLPVVQALADSAVQEFWRDYTVSGTARYGRVRVNTFTFGTGTGGYSFGGHGGAAINNLLSVSLTEDSREGFGQAHFRQDLPESSQLGIFTPVTGIPTVSRFPTAPYPPNARVIQDSIAWAQSTVDALLVAFKDKADSTIVGSYAQFRWKMENSRRKWVEWRVEGHDWMEPCEDEVDFDDPNHTGLTTAESWVIDSVRVQIARNLITSTAKAFTTDPIDAVKRAL